MKVVLEIKLPVGVRELGGIAETLANIHSGRDLFLRQEGPMLQIFYEDEACLPEPTSGECKP